MGTKNGAIYIYNTRVGTSSSGTFLEHGTVVNSIGKKSSLHSGWCKLSENSKGSS